MIVVSRLAKMKQKHLQLCVQTAVNTITHEYLIVKLANQHSKHVKLDSEIWKETMKLFDRMSARIDRAHVRFDYQVFYNAAIGISVGFLGICELFR